jgi:hypothetical protein
LSHAPLNSPCESRDRSMVRRAEVPSFGGVTTQPARASGTTRAVTQFGRRPFLGSRSAGIWLRSAAAPRVDCCTGLHRQLGAESFGRRTSASASWLARRHQMRASCAQVFSPGAPDPPIRRCTRGA